MKDTDLFELNPYVAMAVPQCTVPQCRLWSITTSVAKLIATTLNGTQMKSVVA